jgi:putative transposase
MGRLHLSAGTRYRWDGRTCVVVQVLRDGQLLVEDQPGGGQAVVTREELTAAWDRGAVRFEVRGPGVRTGGEATLSTGYTIADFHLLPEAERGEAWRRYALIRPLLTLPPGARTRRAIAQHLRDAGLAGGAVSRGSVERYLRAFEGSGGDIRALVPSATRRTAGESRLGAEVEGIIQGVLAECRAAPAQRTVRDVYFMVVERVRVRNQGQPPDGRIMVPDRSTIYRRMGVEGPAAILRRRPGPRATRPLERVELDHTVLDLIVVDEEDRLPIGRPTVTLALDVYSGLPAGLHVGFEAAGYGAVMRCLLHAILPKEDVRARYGTQHGWAVYGLPETLVVDRAPHLVGGDLGDACGQLGIALEPSPVKRPWFKGAIERQFRTHNTGLVHGLPGTTFSHVLARGEYDSAGLACISLTRFREILHVYLLDVYGQEWNRGVEGVPAQRWAAAVAGGWTPALHHDAEEMRLLLGRSAVRTIQRAGIDHLCLRYQSAELDALRRALPAGTLVALKYDPEDLGALHVQIPAAQRGEGPAWLRVPALHQEYAGGLTQVWGRPIEGTWEQAVADRRTVCATTGAGSVRHGAFI